MSIQVASSSLIEHSGLPEKLTNAVLIRRKEVQRRTSLSRSQLYALMQKGAFPKQVSLGHKSAAWVDIEVDSWIHDQLAQRAATA